MCGIGIPELIVILFVILSFLGPIIALIVFVSKAEEKIKRESDSLVRKVNEIAVQLRERQGQT
jgi:Na+-translocating ferredoxin:NAD+ oxidoreductase RNF subunit RnfB